MCHVADTGCGLVCLVADSFPWVALWMAVVVLVRSMLLYGVTRPHWVKLPSGTKANPIKTYVSYQSNPITTTVGAAPITSSFSTSHLASINCTKTIAWRDEESLTFRIWCGLYYRFYSNPNYCQLQVTSHYNLCQLQGTSNHNCCQLQPIVTNAVSYKEQPIKTIHNYCQLQGIPNQN